MDDQHKTPQDARPGTSLLRGPHTIDIDIATPLAMAEFLEALAFILRARRGVRITIE